MLTSLFKKCVSRTRMRHFTTLVACRHVETKLQDCWIAMKCSCVTKPKLMQSFSRLYSTEGAEQPEVILPPLLDGPIVLRPSLFSFMNLISGYKINLIDPDFDIGEFVEGSRKAVSVISVALANKDYESLDGLVAPEMIKLLKQKVDSLSEEQRKIIAGSEDDFYVQSPLEISVTRNENPDEWLFKIKQVYYYHKNICPMQNETLDVSKIFQLLKDPKKIVCNYTFERTYKNKVGGEWIATWVNHFSLQA